MAGRRKGKNAFYSYTKLKDLNGGKRVNVMGVVNSFLPANKISDGFVCSLTLIDESRLEVDCSMFHTTLVSLPHQLYPGDILCVREGATEGLAPHVALRMDMRSAWVVFRKNDRYKQLACSMTHQLSAKAPEMVRVEELKKWSTPNGVVASPAAVATASVRHTRQSVSMSSRSSPRLSTPAGHSNHTSSNHLPSHSRSSHASTPLSAHAQFSGSSFPSPVVSKVPQAQVSRPPKIRFHDTSLSSIANLAIGSKDSGVMGVVKYFKPPVRSKGSDCYTVLCITDDSMADFSLTCVLFNPVKEMLPVVCTCGEVVMMKGLSINSFEGLRQAMGHENTLVGIFPLDIESPSPKMIGNFYSMKEPERTRLQQLRSWAAGTSVPLLINSKVEEISLANYCSTVCLVLAVLKPPAGASGVVLVVTDGTVPKHHVRTGTDFLDTISARPNLFYVYDNLASVVHVTTASRPVVSAGDIVQLINIHMVELQQGAVPISAATSEGEGNCTSEELTVELLVEDHERYQGAVKVHSSGSAVVSTFKSGLPVLEGPYPIWKPVDSHLVLSTMVVPGEDIEESTLAQIQLPTTAVGSAHMVDVQVVGVGRRAWSSLEDATQLRCPACMTLYLTPQPHMENYNELLTTGDPCVCCGEEGGEGVALCYMFAFPLLVADHTSKLEVAVSGSEGSKFMPQNPVNLYADPSAKEYLLNLLYLLTGGNDPFHHVPLGPCFSQPRPSIKICITVIKTCSGQRRYKITDSALQLNEI